MDKALGERLAQWLLLECKFNKSARLASEIEVSEVALMTALLGNSSDVQYVTEVSFVCLRDHDHLCGFEDRRVIADL